MLHFHVSGVTGSKFRYVFYNTGKNTYFYFQILFLRHLFLILLLLPALSCPGQRNPCRKISQKKEDNGSLTYRSPDLKHLSVIKYAGADTFFMLLLHFADEYPHFETFGAMIEFADGTIFRSENVKIKCTQEMSVVAGGSMSSGMTNSGKYRLQGSIRITDDIVGKFMLHRIASIGLHNVSRKISAQEAGLVMKYVACLK